MLLSLALWFLFGVTATLADPSPGCDEREIPRRPDGKPSKEFQFQGRDVYISFPPKFRSRKPTSLIIAYHDEGMTGQEFEKLTKFDNPELNRNSIVVYPNARKGRWMTDPKGDFKPQEDSWDSWGEDETNDLFYTKDLLKHLRNTYCINLRRTYAVGLGTGGGMIHQAACQTQLSREVAAFAAVAPAIFKGKDKDDRGWQKCPIGRRPVPVLVVSGVEDKKYPVDESRRVKTKNVLPASAWARNWSRYNRCGEPLEMPGSVSEENTSLLTDFEMGQMAESVAFGGGVNKISYRCGIFRAAKNKDLWKKEPDLRSTSVLHYTVSGAGHGWVRASFEKGPAEVEFKGHTLKTKGSPHFDSSSVILGFFNAHRLPNDETVQAQARDLLIERGAKKYDYTKEAKKAAMLKEKEKRVKELMKEGKVDDTRKKEL